MSILTDIQDKVVGIIENTAKGIAEDVNERVDIVKKSLNIITADENEEETIVNNTITAADSLKRRYGIRQQIVIKNDNEDSYIKAMRILTENCKPKESIEVQCIGDLDYRVGFGVHVIIPFLTSYSDCLMYIKEVEHEWKPNGLFVSNLTLTPSRVMDEQEWSDTEDFTDDESIGVDGELWNKIYNVLKQQIGKPYQYGSQGPDTFDCSGLVCYAYNQFSDEIGFTLQRTTQAMIAQKDLQTIDANNMDEWEPGDLVFPHEGHVVVYVGNKQCIEAMQTGTNVMEHSYSRISTYAVRRVLPEVSSSEVSTSGSNYFSDKLIEFTKSKEGFRNRTYDDGWGTKTIGYGSTSAVKGILGFDPTTKSPCTEKEATEWLKKVMNYNGKNLSDWLKKNNIKLPQNKIDALLDTCYFRPYWFSNSNKLTELCKGNGDALTAFQSIWGSSGGHGTRAKHLADMWSKGLYVRGYDKA